MMKSGGTGFLSCAAVGFFGSLGASAWGKVVGDNTVGMIAFGALFGGVGAELTGGNFWDCAVIGGIVAGLNHVAHSGDDNDDIVRINTKDKTAEVEKTGDNYDRIFVDGKEIMATTKGLLGPELRDNGYSISMKGPQGFGMGLTDFVLDAFNLITGATELKMGVTMLSKRSLGLKVGLGGSEGTLKSSVYYTKTLGINSKMPFRLPTITGKPTNNFGLFLGRNASVFGGARMTAGGYGIFNNN